MGGAALVFCRIEAGRGAGIAKGRSLLHRRTNYPALPQRTTVRGGSPEGAPRAIGQVSAGRSHRDSTWRVAVSISTLPPRNSPLGRPAPGFPMDANGYLAYTGASSNRWRGRVLTESRQLRVRRADRDFPVRQAAKHLGGRFHTSVARAE